MKIIGRVKVMLFIACILSMFNTLNVDAATGRIKFSDPNVAAGEEFEVSVELLTYDDSIDSFYIEFDYDDQLIQYKSSEYSRLEGGKIIFESGESGLDCNEKLVFLALKNDTATVTVSAQDVKSTDGTIFEITEGNSKVVIEGGTEVEPKEIIEDSSENLIVQVQGVDYVINNEFLESKLPLGFEIGEMEIEGMTRMIGLTQNADIILVNLEEFDYVAEEDEVVYGRFFMYNQDTGVFTPYIQVKVSDSTYVAFLTENYPEELPIRYIPTTMSAEGFEFTAWEDSQEQGFYIIYVVNHDGEKILYRYDLIDQSYQRYMIEQEEVNPNAVDDEQLQEVIDFVAENLIVSTTIIALIMSFLLILMIVFGVKLRNRNKELDDIYLGSGLVDMNSLDSKGEKKFEEDEFEEDEFEEDEFEEDEFEEDEFEEDEFEEDEFEEDEFKQDEISTGIESDEFLKNIEFDNPNQLDMLDDGFTQEFNLELDERYFSDNGFIDFQNVENTDQDPEMLSINCSDDIKMHESIEDVKTKQDKLNVSKKKENSRKKKIQEDKSDDDGFEFIEI